MTRDKIQKEIIYPGSSLCICIVMVVRNDSVRNTFHINFCLRQPPSGSDYNCAPFCHVFNGFASVDWCLFTLFLVSINHLFWGKIIFQFTESLSLRFSVWNMLIMFIIWNKVFFYLYYSGYDGWFHAANERCAFCASQLLSQVIYTTGNVICLFDLFLFFHPNKTLNSLDNVWVCALWIHRPFCERVCVQFYSAAVHKHTSALIANVGVCESIVTYAQPFDGSDHSRVLDAPITASVIAHICFFYASL